MLENLKCLITNFPLDIFIMLAFPIFILWWLLSERVSKAKGTIGELRERVDFLEKELEACRKIKISVPEIISGSSVSVISNTNTDKKDDLKIVEGIGPKIEELLYRENIFTFEQLSKTPIEKIKSILEKAGSRFLMHDPTTWPDQAALARDNKWDELKKWQAELDKGRIV